jgi:chaperone required for assembly of F1-ATPase
MSTTLLLADGRNVMFPAQNPGLVDSELTADLIREINARLESEDQMLGIRFLALSSWCAPRISSASC